MPNAQGKAAQGSKSADAGKKQAGLQINPESLTIGALTVKMTEGKVVHRCSSQLIGDILVEELPSSEAGCVVRRMRFMSNLDLEQVVGLASLWAIHRNAGHQWDIHRNAGHQ